MTRLLLLGVLLGILPLAALAQADNPLAGSSCPAPSESADVVICPEYTITNANGSFAVVAVFVRDERFGWLKLTPCDGTIVECDRTYVRAQISGQGEAIEISLDDEPGDGEPQN